MKQKVQIGYRKIQKNPEAYCVNLPKIWMANNHAKQGDCVQIRLEKDGSFNISFVPVQTAKPEISRNVQVNEGGKATSGNRSLIIEAQDNGKITTGDNSPINQENIFIQLFWSKGTIVEAIIVIVLNIIYYFWRKKKETL